MKLQTERLILRLPTIEDAKDIAESINNLNISKWLLVVPYPYSIKDAEWWINHCTEKAKKKPREDYNFNIELKSEKKIIGGIGITDINDFCKTAKIGYWLAEPYWRKGIGSEALEKMLDLAFNKLKLRRIEAEVFAGNPSSGKMLEKFGFKHEGTKKQSEKCKATGEINDAEIYGLLKKDWSKK